MKENMELWGFKRTWSYGASGEHGDRASGEYGARRFQENMELGGFRRT